MHAFCPHHTTARLARLRRLLLLLYRAQPTRVLSNVPISSDRRSLFDRLAASGYGSWSSSMKKTLLLAFGVSCARREPCRHPPLRVADCRCTVLLRSRSAATHPRRLTASPPVSLWKDGPNGRPLYSRHPDCDDYLFYIYGHWMVGPDYTTDRGGICELLLQAALRIRRPAGSIQTMGGKRTAASQSPACRQSSPPRCPQRSAQVLRRMCGIADVAFLLEAAFAIVSMFLLRRHRMFLALMSVFFHQLTSSSFMA